MTLPPAWQKLNHHKTNLHNSIRSLFESDPERFNHYSLRVDNILLDYSKNLINDETRHLLYELANECQLKDHIHALFHGDKVNFTENRPALHTALRMPASKTLMLNGKNIVAEVHQTLAQMEIMVDKIQAHKWLGYSGKAITDVVNIGIGGSDLGPRMATHALKPYHTEAVNCHFVSNLDGSHIVDTLKLLNPETTLFIISSKSFSTLDTLSNAIQAKLWLKNDTNHDISHHFIAITHQKQKALDFGIKHILDLPSWVGGRYSLWSAIGLPIALAVGMKNFRELLSGAHAMDKHFETAEFAHNMPVLLALIGVWHHNFFNAPTQAVLPYNQHLSEFIDHLQQLDMESNGKQVDRSGKTVTYQTGPIIWGGVGTNSQHAFHQLLHQGTHFVPCDFIVCAKTRTPIGQQHSLLYTNCLAQSQALMLGKTLAEAQEELREQGVKEEEVLTLAPHLVIPGNRPSNTLILRELSPYNLGSLIALYEHKVFVQGILWNINSFDQWSVEFGKTLAKNLLPIIQKDTKTTELDSSTRGLLDYYFHCDLL